MLENAGFECFCWRQYRNTSDAYAAGGKKADYAVVEVSSFQLDTIEYILSVCLHCPEYFP